MKEMHIERSPLFSDVRLISPQVFEDDRGCFIETYSIDKYDLRDRAGRPLAFREDDASISHQHVLRGLHGDNKTWKLIQCLYGEVFFALVDNNPASPTYLRHETYLLNDTNRLQVLVPPGFVNGYLCLTERCIFSYKQTETYSGMGCQMALRWNDPKLNIAWPVASPKLSNRDSNIPLLG